MSSNNRRSETVGVGLLVIGMVVLAFASGAGAQSNYKTLHRFTGGQGGAAPQAGLILDQGGNLYGTTSSGGDLPCRGFQGACGVVFKLAPKSNGGWKETVPHRFNDHPGAQPVAGVIFDPAGNLYGTTEGDGITTFGSVFEIP